ncbi:alpha/beta hydrolase [Cupriavidus sp. SK-3]|uniref:alpha/beta hydrolase n=2 Tax=unclassified Cupriavidus TaxID=2640874 RepID=UPI0009DFFED0
MICKSGRRSPTTQESGSRNKMCRARHCALPGTKPPFPSPIAASRPDPLASFERVVHLAGDRRSRLVDPGDGGHINPASGYGPWPGAKE